MNKIFFHPAAFLFMLLSLPALTHAEPWLFEVADWCFCKQVNREKREPVHCLPDPTEAKGNEGLFLWMRIIVNAHGVQYLHSYGKLPIYHAWGRDGWIEGREIDIGIDRKDYQDKKRGIEEEIARHGTFDWTTWSEKVEYLYTGAHFVSVLDAEHRPVVLDRDKYKAFRPLIQVNKR